MNIFGSSKSSTTNQQTTNNYDQRQVDTANGAGAFVAQSGSTFNLTTTDGGAFDLAGNSVDKSIGLASQIATTLGASIGQFSTGATGSIDGLASLLKANQSSVSGQAGASNNMAMLALVLLGLVAFVAVRKGR